MQTTRSKHRRKGGAGSTIALLVLGVLMLAGVAMYCYTRLVPHIEADLTERVTAELANNGITTAAVSLDGTDVTLSGRVESATIASDAEQLALGVYGVTSVRNELNQAADSTAGTSASVESDNTADNTSVANQSADIGETTAEEEVAVATTNEADTESTSSQPETITEDAPATTTASTLAISVDDQKAVVSGILPDTRMALRVSEAMAAIYGEDNVQNEISIVPELEAPDWIDGAVSVLDRIGNISNPTLMFKDDEVVLGGSVSSETLGAQQLSAAKRVLGNDVKVSATFDIIPRASELPAPAATPREAKKRPASLRIASNNNGVRLTGTVSSAEEADTIRIELDELFDSVEYTDELIIDDSVDSADWVDEALAVARSVRSVDNFSVSINSGQMMLSGDVENRDQGKSLAESAATLAGAKLDVVNNYSVNQAALVIDSAEEVLARELSQKLVALDTAKIVFNPGSAELAEDAMAVLDEVATVISAYDDQIVEISGHTDSSGDSVVNLELSKKRAIAVRDYLVSKGLPSNQLRPIGYGESKPVADNTTAAGRAANRRIEFNL